MTQAIDFTVTHRYTDVDISEQEWQYIIEQATWQRMPTFRTRGRSAWHVLREEVSLKSNPAHKLRAAKLKGVGVWNPETSARHRDSLMVPVGGIPMPPTTQPLDSFATYPHFGISKEGEFALVLGKVSPIGGILHDRAVLEFENAKWLTEKGVSSIVPLAVILYEDKYQFDGKPMGAVICLSPAEDPYRLSEVQYGAVMQLGADPDKDAYCEQVRDSLGVTGNLADETTRLTLIKILSRQLGKIIHDFTASGLYRYSSEWSNLEYNFDSKSITLTDLDSTLQLSSLNDELQVLQAIRDLGTLLYRSMAKFVTPTALDKYTLTELLKYDIITDVLLGYFPHASEEECRRISMRLWNAFIPYMFQLKKYREPIVNEWDNERRRSYKMGHDLFYILAIISVLPLFNQSEIAKLYPYPLTEEMLLQKAERYLGDQYEYLLYLLNDGKLPLA